ncbi:MAG: hypothetical protein K1X94_28295, partial [Sandaracinaceae bacterium]|nr:hypothetical protein [Sandaracinaceae bacterium]
SVQALTPLALGGGPTADRAAALVKQVADRLTERALRTGLSSMHPNDLDQLVSTAAQLGELAGKLDQSGRPDVRETQALARWLRGRAIAVIDETIAFEPGAQAGDVGAILEENGETVGARIARRIDWLEDLTNLRRRLEADGAELADAAASQKNLGLALQRLEEDVATLLDAGFRRSMAAVLSRARGNDIDAIVRGLESELAGLDALSARISSLFGQRSRLKDRVVGPRLGSLIATLVAGLDGGDRDGLRARVDELATTLERRDLGKAIAPEQWLGWSAEALVEAEAAVPVTLPSPGFAAYRALRGVEVRTPIAVTLREIAFRVERPAGDSAAEAGAALEGLMRKLPEPLRRSSAEADLSRVERAVALLEAWWATLSAEDRPLDDAQGRLRTIVDSRFLEVVLDEAALLRFALEARVIGETFPDHAERASRMRARVDELRGAVRAHVVALGKAAGDRAWDEVMKRT